MEGFVCVDIGGTAVKYGLATAEGRFLHKGSMPSDLQHGGAEGMVARIVAQVKVYQAQTLVRGLAVSTASMVDPEEGKILYATDNFPGYSGMCLRAKLEAACGVSCTVENDVNCAGLGEMWLGAGKNVRSLFCLTVGTGIGGCIILDGKLLPGASYSAGEIGYLAVGPLANLEKVAAVPALLQQVAAQKKLPVAELDGRKVLAWAEQGDAVAQEALAVQLHYLALGIADVCYLLNPELVIVGGGIMGAEAYLKPRLQQELQQVLVPLVYEHTRLEFAKLKNDAGMLGALCNFLQRQGLAKV